MAAVPATRKASRVLVVDDDYDCREVLQATLCDAGYEASTYECAEDALRALESEDFDVILADVMMPRVAGTDLCRHVAHNHPDVPVIMITAYGNTDIAVDSIRAGAFDFLTKPFDMAELKSTVARAVSMRGERQQVKRLYETRRALENFPEIIGSSAAMRSVIDQLPRIATSESTVLLTGESGTGKELIARALHVRSARRDGPFVAVNCAAVPADILESELFGRVRGAFTGATSAFSGVFREADGGTLFLDEIGAMPLELQPKLLRVLQERSIRPVGGEEERPFDARLVAATNRDLELGVRDGTFREDLLFRLGVLRIALPALRERGDDVLELAFYLIEKFGETMGKPGFVLTPESIAQFREYQWPGNVRELENCIQAALTFARGGAVHVEDLPTNVRSQRARSGSGESRSLESVELQHILRVLDAVGGNKAAAARVLCIDRTTLYRKLERASALGWRESRGRSA
jgi:two-component system, NtrC family, response regulator AtoC